MTRGKSRISRGFFGVAAYHPKREVNVGTLWRSAHVLGASFIATVGRRYEPQAADTSKAWRHLPLWQFATMDELVAALPRECPLVGVELTPDAVPLHQFQHTPRALYLLGAEDHGLPPDVLAQCRAVVKLPGVYSMNVAVAGSIVMHHRVTIGARSWQAVTS